MWSFWVGVSGLCCFGTTDLYPRSHTADALCMFFMLFLRMSWTKCDKGIWSSGRARQALSLGLLESDSYGERLGLGWDLVNIRIINRARRKS